MITPIQGLEPLGQLQRAQNRTENEGADFGSILRSVADSVRETDAERSMAEHQLATGQMDNPAALMISMAKNEIAVNLMVQLRNKSVEAYNELMRMNI